MIRGARVEDLLGIEELLREADLPTEGVADHLPSFLVFEEGARILATAGVEWHLDAGLLRSVVVARNA
jgi:N-acetylglutamate synthase-like GNAT family acetyltransferase